MADSPINLIRFSSRDEWLSVRTGSIGASESPALFGLSPWSSELSLYAEKVGAGSTREQSEAMEWGLELEEPIARKYSKRTGRTLWTDPESGLVMATHPTYRFVTCSPDRLIVVAPDRAGDGPGVLEIKNHSRADSWDHGPPLYVQAQVQHQLWVTGLKWGATVALLNGNRLVHFDVERNEDYIRDLEKVCVAFWERVVRRDPPAPDGSQASTNAIKALHPLDNGSSMVLDDSHVAAWDALQRTKEAIKALEVRERELQNMLTAAIGDATFGSLPDGTVLSWRHQTTPARTQVVPERTFRVLRAVKQTKQTKGTRT